MIFLFLDFLYVYTAYLHPNFLEYLQTISSQKFFEWGSGYHKVDRQIDDILIT